MNVPVTHYGRNLNLMSRDIADMLRQGIGVDDDNTPVPGKIPALQQAEAQAQGGDTKVWRPIGIICPRWAGNLPYSFSCFKNDSKEKVMKIKHFELFLILFPVD